MNSTLHPPLAIHGTKGMLLRSVSNKFRNQHICNNSNLFSSFLHVLEVNALKCLVWKGSLWRINPPYTMWRNQAVWLLLERLITNCSVWWQWDEHVCFEYSFLWIIHSKRGESFQSSEGPSSRGQCRTAAPAQPASAASLWTFKHNLLQIWSFSACFCHTTTEVDQFVACVSE